VTASLHARAKAKHVVKKLAAKNEMHRLEVAATARRAQGLPQNNGVGSARVVTPAKAEVQAISDNLDSGFRRNDGKDVPHGVWVQL
jgi:hypothetical protein